MPRRSCRLDPLVRPIAGGLKAFAGGLCAANPDLHGHATGIQGEAVVGVPGTGSGTLVATDISTLDYVIVG